MTQVSWTRQLGLAAVLFALGTFAYWEEFKHRPEKEAADEQSKKLFSLEATPIQSIRLGRSGQPEIVFTCLDMSSKRCKPGDQSKWQITEPSQLRADDSNVSSLISVLNRLSVSETISLKDETPEKRAILLKDYGLDFDSRKTAKKVEINTEKGTTILFLGGTHPIGESIFGVEEKVAAGQKPTGKINEDQVFLIPNYFKANLEHDLGYWRDKKLLTLESHEIESFRLEGSKVISSCDRKGHPWNIKSQERDLPGDSDVIQALLNAATALKAKTFVSDHKSDAVAQAALQGTSRVLTLGFTKDPGTGQAAQDPVTLTFYRNKTGKEPVRLYATVSNTDPLYELEANSIDRLDKGPTDLRLSRLLSTLERFSMKRLEFSGKVLGQTPLILAQKDGKWTFEGDSQEVDSAKVLALLDRLSGSAVKEFLTGSSIPKGETEGLNIKTTDDKNSRTFVFWKNPAPQKSTSASGASALYAKEAESPYKEAFLVDSILIDALPWNRDFFLKPKPKTEASPSAEKMKK